MNKALGLKPAQWSCVDRSLHHTNTVYTCVCVDQIDTALYDDDNYNNTWVSVVAVFKQKSPKNT